MPSFLHDHLAQAYHLGLRVLGSPLWRAPLAALVVAAMLRLARRPGPAVAAGLAVLAGWVALLLPDLALPPRVPLERMPGAGVILLAVALIGMSRGWGRGRRGGLGALLLATVLAWWLRGAPIEGAGLANTVPWALGLWAALAIARRWSAADQGPATLAAAAALAGALYLSGASAHWCRAAAVPGWAGLVLLGLPEAMPVLVAAVLAAGMAAVSASDRGRFLPVDLAVLAPFLVWWGAPRVLPRLNRAGPMLAAVLCAVAAVAGVAAATALLNLR